MKKNRAERGSVTIEATISLSTFMFAIVTILTFTNICIVQSRMAYAINATAKEISQYSYLYSLTGLNQSQSELYEAGKVQTDKVDQLLGDLNTTYNEIQNLGSNAKKSTVNIDDITGLWDDAGNVKGDIEEIAKDPKNLLLGIAKSGASDAFDLAKSRLVAAPLSKVMCKKHLVDEKKGDVNAYLKSLGVVPAANGSYVDGLDFSRSTLFPNGSSEISVSVAYDVKVIALLPIDFSFHFHQTAYTRGWFAGDTSYENEQKKMESNESLWTQSTIQERSDYIRHMGIQEELKNGCLQTSGMTDVPLYDPNNNEFKMISSMNPLYNEDPNHPYTLDDLSDTALQNNIERLCNKMKSGTENYDVVTVKNADGTKSEYSSKNASNTIILVVPEDEGLKGRVEEVIAKSNTNGVKIEVVANYGKGASASEVKQEEQS